VLQTLQTASPVVVEEPAEAVHLGVIGPVEATGSVPAFDDQLGLPKDAEVLGDGRPGDIVESGGDLGGRELLAPHQFEDLPAAGFGQGLECGVHANNISVYLRKCQLTEVAPAKACLLLVR
jgi:hypothetical protein